MDDLDDFLDSDLDVVPVIAGAITGDGYLDLNSEMIFISVNGETYKVEMSPQRFDDGKFCRIPLAKVDAPAPLYVILNGDPSGTTNDPAPTDPPILIFNGDS